MKHPATRELYQYWTQRRGLRAVPDRSDIEPAHLKGMLADTFLLSVDGKAGHPFRIAGTRLCALFGRELKGRSFVGLWDEGLRVLDLLDLVIKERVGMVAGAHATLDGARADMELLVLPLTQGGTRPARFIGVLAPFDRPYWLGTRPVPRLALGIHRHVGGGFEHLGPRLISGAQADRFRDGQADRFRDGQADRVRDSLQVLEGGRA